MVKQQFHHVTAWVFDLDNTLYPPQFRLFDQIETRMTAWVMQALGVGLWAEGPDGAVLVAVCLDALEDLLPVVQHRRGRVQRDRAVGHHFGIMPAGFLFPAHGHHVVGEMQAKTGFFQNFGAVFSAAWVA